MILCQVKELWNISEKDWLNLSNKWFLLRFFYTQKNSRGSIHKRKESFPVKPFLGPNLMGIHVVRNSTSERFEKNSDSIH